MAIGGFGEPDLFAFCMNAFVGCVHSVHFLKCFASFCASFCLGVVSGFVHRAERSSRVDTTHSREKSGYLLYTACVVNLERVVV